MQDIRTIGGAGGVFHILVPGVFLLLNILFCVYLFPLTDSESKEAIRNLFINPTMGLVITIGFGYLIGVILRIFRSEYPDKLSAKFLRRIDNNAKPPMTDGNRYAYEDFPYTLWMERVCRSLPADVQYFYQKVWRKQGNSKTFLNFSKIMIISEDERAANEIYSAESLSRYISGMFYALVISTTLIMVVLLFQIAVLIIPEVLKVSTPQLPSSIALFLFLIGYVIAILGILSNYRFMRLKEVQTVFFCSFKNRTLFQQSCLNQEDEERE